MSGVLSVRSFLVRGLLAGLVAGFIAFGVAFVVGEPSIDAAIAIEESGSGHTHADESAGTSTSGLKTSPMRTSVTRSFVSGCLRMKRPKLKPL